MQICRIQQVMQGFVTCSSLPDQSPILCNTVRRKASLRPLAQTKLSRRFIPYIFLNTGLPASFCDMFQFLLLDASEKMFLQNFNVISQIIVTQSAVSFRHYLRGHYGCEKSRNISVLHKADTDKPNSSNIRKHASPVTYLDRRRNSDLLCDVTFTDSFTAAR